MYDELIKRLHEQAVYLPEKFSKNAELLDVLMKAADAIEELQKAEEAEWTEENTCSHCGDEACAGYDEEPWLTRYCPHCGAKMKNPEDYE